MKTGSLSDYAKYKNVNRSTVTRWKQADRLVFDDNGLVNFKASDKRIKATEDPNRDDVRARHENKRAKNADDLDSEQETNTVNIGFQESRAIKEHYKALQAKIDYEKKSGNYLDRESVEMNWVRAAATIREGLELIASQQSVNLASENEPTKIYDLLMHEFSIVLNKASDAIKGIED